MKTHFPVKTVAKVKQYFPNGIDKLELGSGENPETGYVHVDIQQSPDLEILADVKNLPIPDNFVTEEIRAVHIMEHFCHPEYASKEMRKSIGTTVDILKEAYRTLAPGGVLKIVTPDFQKITESAAKRRVSRYWLQRWTVGGHLNEFDVHHWLWTHEDAKTWLTEVGFVDVKDWNPSNNIIRRLLLNWDDPRFQPNKDWFRTEWYHWLFISARKP